MTAFNEQEYLIKAIDAGVDKYILKPIDMGALTNALFSSAVLLSHQREMEARNNYIHFILDANPGFLITTTGKQLEYINKTFLNFLGYSSIEEFKKQHTCIDEFIISIDGRPYPNESGRRWVNLIISQPDKDHIVYIQRGGEPHPIITAHLVTCTKFPELDKYILSLTDITNLEKEKIRLQQEALTDHLTGAYNRNYLNQSLAVEIQRARRYGIPMSFIILDIDNFKKINDTYGHNVGDDVLKTLVRTITANIRKSDIFGRWGGEEFVILTPHTDKEQAVLLAEKLRKTIEDSDFQTVGRVTCSFGVTDLMPEMCAAREITERADAALYDAKRKNGSETKSKREGKMNRCSSSSPNLQRWER